MTQKKIRAGTATAEDMKNTLKEHEIKIHKDAEEEAIAAITRRKATFGYTFSYLDEMFFGIDVLVFYDEVDSFEQTQECPTKKVIGFEVDDNSVTADLTILQDTICEVFSSYDGTIEIDDNNREKFIKKIMHNIKNFIYRNEITITK